MLPLETLERLVAERRISINDFRCLDGRTKQRIRRMYLRNLKLQIARQTVDDQSGAQS